jgi:hypothetical protein
MNRASQLWAWLLLATDRLLGTRLLEQALAQKQAQIEQLVTHLETVNQDLDALAQELAFYRLALCLIELKARGERDDVDDWLCFAPPGKGATQSEHSEPAGGEPAGIGDEPVLDGAIECLVKPRLATIDVAPAESGGYIYRLHPDWAAIIAHLDGTAVASELMSWLEEQV